MIGLVILSWLTCVCVSPKIEASSARSGSARYCVRWNLRSSCCICSEEYMVRGFRIFFPLLLTRVSSPFSIDSLISPPASVNTVPSMTYITKSITALTLTSYLPKPFQVPQLLSPSRQPWRFLNWLGLVLKPKLSRNSSYNTSNSMSILKEVWGMS